MTSPGAALTVSSLATTVLTERPFGDPTPGSGGIGPRQPAVGPWLGTTAIPPDNNSATLQNLHTVGYR